MIPEQAEIDRIFNLQRQHYPALRSTTAEERIEKLQLLQAAILKNRKGLEDAVYADLRKPPHEAALTEIYMVTSEIKHACKNLHSWMKPVQVENPPTFLGARAEIRYEPKGQVLILSPWNYPFQLAIAPLVAAIAAGNCAIVKPSEISASTSAFVHRLLSETYYENEVAVFEGDPTIASALLEKPFHHIFFTGSPPVGKIVMKAAAEHLAAVTLEMGGKSPALIDQQFPLNEACRKIAWGKFVNAGQTCLAPDYVLLPEERQDDFVQTMKKAIFELYGDPKTSTDYCKIISPKHHLRLKNILDDATGKGARVEAGGEYDEQSHYFAPTLITGAARDSLILQEEIFGPLLPIVTYKTMDDALSTVNSLSRPLALYVFSRQQKFIESVIGRTISGGVCVNETVVHFADLCLPFGGINTSGIGNAHGYFGFKAFSHERSVLFQPRRGTMTFLYPPYTRKIKKLLEWTIRYF